MIAADAVRTLEAAAAIIRQVRDPLNSSKKPCACCGQDAFVDWNERQMRENLNAAITRIERVQDRITEASCSTSTPGYSGCRG